MPLPYHNRTFAVGHRRGETVVWACESGDLLHEIREVVLPRPQLINRKTDGAIELLLQSIQVEQTGDDLIRHTIDLETDNAIRTPVSDRRSELRAQDGCHAGHAIDRDRKCRLRPLRTAPRREPLGPM